MHGFNERFFFLLLREPERLFENLKKRFSKRKNALKRLKRSGAGRNDGVQKAEEELRKYAFLEWTNPYVATRDSISNLDVTPGRSDVVNGNLHEEFEEEEMMRKAMKKILKEMITKLKPKLQKEKSKAKSRM